MDEQLRFLDQLTAAAVEATTGIWPEACRGRGSSLVERITHLLVLALFAIMALQNLGVQLLPLLAGLGIAGAGIALAMQGVLGNLIAGLTIIFSQPFRVGDYISIVEEEGVVLDIDLFNTTLGHPDSRGGDPNRKIVGEILHNYGRIRQLASR